MRVLAQRLRSSPATKGSRWAGVVSVANGGRAQRGEGFVNIPNCFDLYKTVKYQGIQGRHGKVVYFREV